MRCSMEKEVVLSEGHLIEDLNGTSRIEDGVVIICFQCCTIRFLARAFRHNVVIMLMSTRQPKTAQQITYRGLSAIRYFGVVIVSGRHSSSSSNFSRLGCPSGARPLLFLQFFRDKLLFR